MLCVFVLIYVNSLYFLYFLHDIIVLLIFYYGSFGVTINI